MGLLERDYLGFLCLLPWHQCLVSWVNVIGMIGAFDAIEAAGDISPSLVAGGIKVALLTTVFGLIVLLSYKHSTTIW